MAGVLRTFFSLVSRVAGVSYSWPGTMNAPLKEAAVGDDIPVREEFTIAAGGTAEVYNYSRDGSFEAYGIHLPAGYCNVHIGIDIPTSDEDLTPSGTGPRWMQLDKSCVVPMVLDTDQVRTTTTANLADWYGPTTSILTSTPTLLGSANAVNGKVYRVIVKNPGTEPITVQRFKKN